MRIIYLVFFLVCSNFTYAQQNSLITLSKVDISTKIFSEYNFISIDNELFYVSDRATTNFKKVTDTKNNNLNQIYSRTHRKDKFSTPKVLDVDFYNHIGSFSINQQRNFILFTGRQTDTSSTFGIFQTEKTKNGWSKPGLIFENLQEFNFLDPYLTVSGDTLYFSSDMADGRGGLDLFQATGSKGNWENITNLGDAVNTKDNERYPTYTGGSLYFASNRPSGIGGYDIYVNTLLDGSLSNTLLLSPPLNSLADDFFVNVKSNSLFFSSNRDGSDDVFELKTNFPEFDCIPVEPLIRCYEFSDEFSDVKDSLTYAYKWLMGDGVEYDGVIAEHCFQDTGLYIVELKVFEILTKKIISIESSFEMKIEDPIQLELNIPEKIESGQLIEFNVTDDVFADSSVYYWDFGDGNYARGESIMHKYLQKGIFQISVGRIFFQGEEELHICTSKEININ
jgi:hypothetical protein